MKKNGLIVEMVIFFLLITFLFTAIIIYEKGNPLRFYLAKKEIAAYLDKNYKERQDGFIISQLIYDKQSRAYIMDITDPKDDNEFEIRYTKDNKIVDTYNGLKEDK